jgi:competence protein ComEC
MSLGIIRWWAVQSNFNPTDLAWYNDQGRVSVVGVVAQDPDVRDSYVQVRVQVEQLSAEVGGQPMAVEGLLLAYLPKGDWGYGDRLYISGELLTPPSAEDFSYRDYLARWGIYSYMPFAFADRLETGQGSHLKTWVYTFKQTALEKVYRYFPDPEASLVAGILLGVESGISEEVERAFQDTGTTHIIAISGFNITIIAGLFGVLFGRLLGPRRGAFVAVLGIAVYTFLVGGDAPVVRAAIMGGFSLFARQVGRRQHGINSLSFTAALMLAFNPLLLWDAGFQLSFAATFGLILYAEPWTTALEGWLGSRVSAQLTKKLTGPISEYFLLTLAAQLTTFPIIVYHFQRVSWVSLPANLAILPAQPPIMILGGLSVLIGFVIPSLGQACAYLAWPFVAYTIRMVEWIAGFEQAGSIGQVSMLVVGGYYLLLFLVTFLYSPQWKKALPKIRPVIVMAVLLICAVLVWCAALAAPDKLLHTTILDVGDGGAVLIQTPEGRYILIGGGSSPIRLSDSLGRFLPLFHRQLDMLLVPTTQKQHLTALPEVVERFPPSQVYWAGDPRDSRFSEELYADLQADHIPIHPITPGAVVDLGGGAHLEVLASDEEGMLLLLRWEGFRLLLPVYPDGSCDQIRHQLPSAGRVTALVLAIDEIENCPLPDWFSASQAQLVVTGRPTAEGSSGMGTTSMPVLQTYLVGWVELVTDGESLWIQVESD